VTPRWMLIAFLIFGLIWLAFGTLKLTQGETGMGVANLALSIGYLLVAAFKARQRTTAGSPDRGP
jgi:hypothetical protein